MRAFTPGFLGSIRPDAAAWFAEKTKQVRARTVICPFTGSARAVAMMSEMNPGMTIQTWDTQIIPRCFVEGIFTASVPEIKIDQLRLRRGVMFNERPFKGMPDDAAGIVDYIGSVGSMFEKACIAGAVARCTYRGRMGEWGDGTALDLWKSYKGFQRRHAAFCGLPATWLHTQGDVYKTSPAGLKCDVLFIDPPKVVTNTDAYNKTFDPIDRALGGLVTFDKWYYHDYIDRMTRLLDNFEWQHLLFMYTSGVRPHWPVLRYHLLQWGELLDELWVPHGARNDYLIHIRRASDA